MYQIFMLILWEPQHQIGVIQRTLLASDPLLAGALCGLHKQNTIKTSDGV